MNITLNLNGLVQQQVAKVQSKLNGALQLAQGLQQIAVSMQNFNPTLNKNFPKQDEIVAHFDQSLTSKVSEFKTGMLEVRAKIPQPKPPVTPVVAVWPGVPGGSFGT